MMPPISVGLKMPVTSIEINKAPRNRASSPFVATPSTAATPRSWAEDDAARRKRLRRQREVPFRRLVSSGTQTDGFGKEGKVLHCRELQFSLDSLAPRNGKELLPRSNWLKHGRTKVEEVTDELISDPQPPAQAGSVGSTGSNPSLSRPDTGPDRPPTHSDLNRAAAAAKLAALDGSDHDDSSEPGSPSELSHASKILLQSYKGESRNGTPEAPSVSRQNSRGASAALSPPPVNRVVPAIPAIQPIFAPMTNIPSSHHFLTELEGDLPEPSRWGIRKPRVVEKTQEAFDNYSFSFARSSLEDESKDQPYDGVPEWEDPEDQLSGRSDAHLVHPNLAYFYSSPPPSTYHPTPSTSPPLSSSAGTITGGIPRSATQLPDDNEDDGELLDPQPVIGGLTVALVATEAGTPLRSPGPAKVALAGELRQEHSDGQRGYPAREALHGGKTTTDRHEIAINEERTIQTAGLPQRPPVDSTRHVLSGDPPRSGSRAQTDSPQPRRPLYGAKPAISSMSPSPSPSTHHKSRLGSGLTGFSGHASQQFGGRTFPSPNSSPMSERGGPLTASDLRTSRRQDSPDRQYPLEASVVPPSLRSTLVTSESLLLHQARHSSGLQPVNLLERYSVTGKPTRKFRRWKISSADQMRMHPDERATALDLLVATSDVLNDVHTAVKSVQELPGPDLKSKAMAKICDSVDDLAQTQLPTRFSKMGRAKLLASG